MEIRRVGKDAGGRLAARRDHQQLLVEEPLSIVVNDHPVSELMRTPGHDRELAAGFVLTEGVIDSTDHIASIKQCRGGPTLAIQVESGGQRDGTADEDADDAQGPLNVVQIWTIDGVTPRLKGFREVRSSCSLCGSEVIEECLAGLGPQAPENAQEHFWTIDELVGLTDRMGKSQPLFVATGASHAAGIFSRAGDLLALGEDIGRHNALDKAIGTLAFRNALRPDHAIALSSRLSFEMVMKSWRSGIKNVVAVSAASSLAVEFARRVEIQVASFARDSSLNLY